MLAGLLNQSVTIKTESSTDKYGRKTHGSGTAVDARVELKERRRLQPNGELLVTHARVIVPHDTTVDTDDLISYNSVTYRVVFINVATDGAGNTHHKTLEVTKWPT